MTDTTCPSCDAPAPAGSRRCSRCGYGFLEDGGGRPRPQLRVSRFALGVAALAAAALVAIVLTTGGGEPGRAAPEPVRSHVAVLSPHPLGNAAAERLLEQRLLGVRKDDKSVFVHCSRRVPQPAHSVRRCHLGYFGGGGFAVELITTANGAEIVRGP